MEIKKPDKKSLQYLGIIVIIAIIVSVGFFYYLKWTEIEEVSEQEPAEKTMEEVIKELTTPQGEPKPLSEEIINDLISSEKKGKPISLPEEIINNLTTPE